MWFAVLLAHTISSMKSRNQRRQRSINEKFPKNIGQIGGADFGPLPRGVVVSFTLAVGFVQQYSCWQRLFAQLSLQQGRWRMSSQKALENFARKYMGPLDQTCSKSTVATRRFQRQRPTRIFGAYSHMTSVMVATCWTQCRGRRCFKKLNGRNLAW